MSFEEKRLHKRYAIDASGEIIFTDNVIEGLVTDISFGGFHIKNEQFSQDHMGAEVDIKITTKLNSEQYCIEGRSRVVRCIDGCMGLHFIGMETENITALNELILKLSLQESDCE
ncbi:MAG: PilZ domain-containing protein [Gammaproteobacteria bacterium]|nr:PilZ domain-containing protein [Gammaproteobacteria bacterium]